VAAQVGRPPVGRRLRLLLLALPQVVRVEPSGGRRCRRRPWRQERQMIQRPQLRLRFDSVIWLWSNFQPHSIAAST
jgi:hypothetical protein